MNIRTPRTKSALESVERLIRDAVDDRFRSIERDFNLTKANAMDGKSIATVVEMFLRRDEKYLDFVNGIILEACSNPERMEAVRAIRTHLTKRSTD